MKLAIVLLQCLDSCSKYDTLLIALHFSLHASADSRIRRWDRAEREGKLFDDVPANHSGYFAPVIQPTLRVGFEALCVAALTFLGDNS